MKARIWLLQGRLAQALEWVREQGLSPDDDISFLREYDYFTLARILIAQYKRDRMEDTIEAASRLLDRLLKAAEEGNRLSSVIEILALQAIAHQAQADIPTAIAILERALALAQPEDYIRIFVNEGKPIAELLTGVEAKAGVPRVREYARHLLSFIEPEIRPAKNILVEPEAQAAKTNLLEPLSQRELEVLRLLRTEMNGPEIARELTVSLNTVRTHTQNIYAKLGVNNRRAAVRRAEELNLM
jgi:LuxR family maltose regulon positive regulatory protein